MERAPIIVWFRRDLRLADNPALAEAARAGVPVLPLYIWDPEAEGTWAPGAAARWWLHHSLAALSQSLAARGAHLVIRTGHTSAVLQQVMQETGARAVYWNRLYEPALIQRDQQIKTALSRCGMTATSFNAALLHEPWTVLTQQGRPYQVFTPFYRACTATGEPSSPEPAPGTLRPFTGRMESLSVEHLGLLPAMDWAGGLRKAWQPGEAGANRLLKDFSAAAAERYHERRDQPGLAGTSRLSPHLHAGEISPRQVWQAIRRSGLANVEPYLRQLVWREFAHHLLYHFPHTATQPLRQEFKDFPWSASPTLLQAWQKGRTGYPIVDAGLRELWHTGWMHNRVRMIVASFLVKDLLISWQEGARWFWYTLVDADLANNTLGWQWTAGCGADAAPYFRIFNPYLQGAKFDPEGVYVRRWIPELGKLPARFIHRPDQAPDHVLRAADVRIGHNYPHPIVDHAAARDEALEAYQLMKR